MDTDEIYKPEEYKFALEEFIAGDYDSSACQLITYYKDAKHVIDPSEDYYVPLFYKIDNRKLEALLFPVIADPSRLMDARKLKIFKRCEIQMHHLSYVRKNIRQKLENMSASINWRGKIDNLVTVHDNWHGGKAVIAPDIVVCTREVKSII